MSDSETVSCHSEKVFRMNMSHDAVFEERNNEVNVWKCKETSCVREKNQLFESINDLSAIRRPRCKALSFRCRAVLKYMTSLARSFAPSPSWRRDRIVVSTLRCGRSNLGSNPSHGSGYCKHSSLCCTCASDELKKIIANEEFRFAARSFSHSECSRNLSGAPEFKNKTWARHLTSHSH